jgi:hypothetical protein
MAVILYNNGIVEEIKPNNFTFTEKEILKLFENYKNVRSRRLIEVPNAWCLWGEMEHPEAIDFNKLATDIVEIHVFSHLIVIHDSEIDPDWNMTDILNKNYVEFRDDLAEFVDSIAQRIIDEAESREETPSIYLTTSGLTKDKHVVYMFDPNEQSPDFYDNGSFDNFSEKIFEYFQENFKLKDHLTIFADKKIIINVDKENVPIFFNKIIKSFENKEDYEICHELNSIYKNWSSYVSKDKKKRGRPPKKKENE